MRLRKERKLDDHSPKYTSTYKATQIVWGILLVLGTILSISALTTNPPFEASEKDVAILRLSNFLTPFIGMVVPGIIMFFERIRKMIPLFKHKKLPSTIFGVTTLVIISFVLSISADGFMSESYKEAYESYATKIAQEEEYDGNISNDESQTEFATGDIKPDNKYEDVSEYKILIKAGVDESAAINLLDIVLENEMPIWGENDTITVEKENSSDYIVSYTAKDGVVTPIFAAHIINGKVVEIVDSNLNPIYSNGTFNTDYLFYADINIEGLIDYTKEAVLMVLKAPSTAEFQGSWLNPYENWSIAKDGKIVQVSSVVDSQNSFGAMIRSNFTLRYKYQADKSLQPIYFIFDGQVLIDEE